MQLGSLLCVRDGVRWKENWLCGVCMLQLLWPSLSLSVLSCFVALPFLVASIQVLHLVCRHPALSPHQSLPPLQASRAKKRLQAQGLAIHSLHLAITAATSLLPISCLFLLYFPSFNVRGKTAGDESTQQLVHFHSQPQLLCFSHNQANLWKSNYGSLVSQDPFFRNRET